MGKIKHSKNELKKQKEILKRLTRYLPTLELKKKQLLQEISKIRSDIRELNADIDRLEKRVEKWADVFAEDINITDLLSVLEIKTGMGNIAGIDIPIFQEVIFDEKDYDLFVYPLWVDAAIDVSKEYTTLKAKLTVDKKKLQIIQEELRITIQRINLFDKVKIPETRENIRVIQIFLGDLQTAEVVRGKIAKAKIEKKRANSHRQQTYAEQYSYE